MFSGVKRVDAERGRPEGYVSRVPEIRGLQGPGLINQGDIMNNFWQSKTRDL